MLDGPFVVLDFSTARSATISRPTHVVVGGVCKAAGDVAGRAFVTVVRQLAAASWVTARARLERLAPR